MNAMNLRLLALVLAAVPAASMADVASLFDDFDDNPLAENHVGFANWNVVSGSVDIAGIGGFDPLPGHGRYVDLDGSTLEAGVIATKSAFAPGRYVLRFDFAGNQRGYSPDTLSYSLGGATESFTVASPTPFATVARTVTLAASSRLSFACAGGDNVGPLLDNVSVQAVPEPPALAALGIGALALLRRRGDR